MEKLMRGGNIAKYVRAQRIKWWEYLDRMEDYVMESHNN
jgi:hypothetical protein